MSIVGIAGAMKLLDLYSFKVSIEQWTVFPLLMKVLAVFALPALEVLLAGAWILNIERKHAFYSTLSLLFVFVAASLFQMFFGQMPECGCFGVLEKWIAFSEGTYTTLVRSLLMTILVLIAYFISPSVCITLKATPIKDRPLLLL